MCPVALVLLLGLATLTSCGGGHSANGDQAAGRRSPGAPGELLTADVVFAAPAGIRAWVVTYRSRSAGNGTVEVSGIVLAPPPTVAVPAGGRKVVSFAHGTTGIADICAPSRSTPPLSSAAWTFPLVRAGYVVTLTDYAGLGTPGEHAIYVSGPEGRAVLDAARAARALTATGAGRDVVAWGYSQGGQAVLAAGAQAVTYAPDLRVRGIVATAPLADLPASLTTLQGNADGVGYLLLAMIGLTDTDPTIDLTRSLTQTGRRLLAIARDKCAIDVMTASVGTSISTAFTSDPLADPRFMSGFGRQRDEILRRMAPTLLLQGGRDIVIRPSVTDRVDLRLCGQGTPVDYRRYPSADHGTILAASMNDLMSWMAGRFAANPPPATTNCARTLDIRH
ncbi:lipase family protein [Frankia sp. AgKG'84/4]|uniref:lipase family protein n=1 Tax=Frankia sp. AgKG'84/4 TaxID=573490 RepID=UPI00200D57F9|nr:lipase family protein [Frankia sp. AgKG'84/4]MCL9795653.1 lipase family protein [Frankia sp. AgKG'84/4]